MAERTKDELADALLAVTEPNYVLGIGDRLRVREAAARLRSMPEGKRIEGYAVKIEEDEEGSVYFVRDSGPIPEWGVPAVLFLEHREGKSDG